MCGRYTLRVSPAELVEIFGVLQAMEFSPRYNVAPTQTVAAVRRAESGKREFAALKWGLIPSWADDAKIGSRLINARAETVSSKPSFRSAFGKRRCLIPADGFYEWQAIPGSKTKQPFLIGVIDAPVFGFAGLWERWTNLQGEAIDSCTIVTTEANALMQKVHNRMPVILHRDDYDAWLDCEHHKPPDVLPLLKPYPAEKMQLTPVSTLVNSPRNDRTECVKPLT
jgi:putative SOS response-associated peptidase YedK